MKLSLSNTCNIKTQFWNADRSEAKSYYNWGSGSTPEPPPSPSFPDNKVTIFSQSFSNTEVQDPYAYTDVQNDWPWETNWTNGWGRSSYVSGEYTDQVAIEVKDGYKTMKNKYPANAWGVGTEWNNTTVGTGINAELMFESSNGIEEVYLSYNIKFSTGFDWGLGGKLPGLRACPLETSSSIYSNPETWEGTSCRMMWQPYGYAKFYDYWHSTIPYNYGQGPSIGLTFEPDVWYNVSQRFVMSGVGEYNGIHEIFIDGVLEYSWTSNMGREVANVGWCGLSLATFQGGGDTSYATSGSHFNWMTDFDLWYISGTGSTAQPVGRTASPSGRDISDYIIMKV